MVYQIDITDSAINDLKSATKYISETLKNRVAANNLLNDAETAFTSLSEFPERNPTVNDEFLAGRGIRWIAIHNYIAFYIVKGSYITILRFLYSGRNWKNLLESE